MFSCINRSRALLRTPRNVHQPKIQLSSSNRATHLVTRSSPFHSSSLLSRSVLPAPSAFALPSGTSLTKQRTVAHRHWATSYSTAAAMSTNLDSTLTPELLSGVREFWFEHLPHEDSLILLGEDDAKPWYFGGKAFDEVCVERFAPALKAIKASGATTGKQILDAAQPSKPLDWLSLVILLDQMPRNCYRGASAGIVFTLFDPIARDVAQEAIKRGIPDEVPEIRWRFAYRQWFYLPLMHSEDLATHELAVIEYDKVIADVEAVCAESHTSSDDAHRARAAKVVSGKEEAARAMAKMGAGFEKKHFDIIKRFGRYPHRNEAMGREMTVEEKEYLENGGETFGSSG